MASFNNTVQFVYEIAGDPILFDADNVKISFAWTNAEPMSRIIRINGLLGISGHYGVTVLPKPKPIRSYVHMEGNAWLLLNAPWNSPPKNIIEADRQDAFLLEVVAPPNKTASGEGDVFRAFNLECLNLIVPAGETVGIDVVCEILRYGDGGARMDATGAGQSVTCYGVWINLF